MFRETWFDRLLFSFGPIFILAIFAIILIVFVYVIGSAITQGVRNKQSPVLPRYARIAGRRTHNWGERSTSYYLTFELENGERLEFMVTGEQFGLLADGDMGTLVTQGTAFRSFDRV